MTVLCVTSKAMVSWPTIFDRHVELLDLDDGRMQRQTAEIGGAQPCACAAQKPRVSRSALRP